MSCCPTNIARTLARLAGYVATVDDGGLQVHQYAAAEISTTLGDGRPVAVDVDTTYPRDGVIGIRVRRTTPEPWTLTLRVPSWASGARLVVTPAGATPTEQPAPPGAVAVSRAWAEGDAVTLHLPMAPRFTAPDPRIDAVRGCLAVERGPEVQCLESIDLAPIDGAGDVAAIQVDPSVPPGEADGRVVVRLRTLPPGAPDWPYAGGEAGSTSDPVDVPLVPYHEWAGRGPSTMRVWLPIAPG